MAITNGYSKEKIMTLASEQLLDDAANRAVRNMVTFLHEELQMSKADATLLLSAAGDLKVCQVVDPLKNGTNGTKYGLCGEVRF